MPTKRVTVIVRRRRPSSPGRYYGVKYRRLGPRAVEVTLLRGKSK